MYLREIVHSTCTHAPVGGVYARIGPEKGVIHLALAAVDNAVWDMFARSRKKPLWKLIVDMTPVRRSYISHMIGSN